MPASPIVGGPRTRGRSPSRARGSRAGRRPTRCSAAVAPRRLALTPRAKKRCRTQRATPSRPLRPVCMMSCIRGSSDTAGINLVTQQYRSLGSSARRVGVELPRGGGRCRYRFEPSPHAGVGRGDTTVEVTADGASSRRGGSMLSRARARNCSSVQSDLATPTTGPSRWPLRVIAWRAGNIFFVTTARCVRRERSQRDPSRPGLGPLGPSHTPPRFGTSPPRQQQGSSSGCVHAGGDSAAGRGGGRRDLSRRVPARPCPCVRRRERERRRPPRPAAATYADAALTPAR